MWLCDKAHLGSTLNTKKTKRMNNSSKELRKEKNRQFMEDEINSKRSPKKTLNLLKRKKWRKERIKILKTLIFTDQSDNYQNCLRCLGRAFLVPGVWVQISVVILEGNEQYLLTSQICTLYDISSHFWDSAIKNPRHIHTKCPCRESCGLCLHTQLQGSQGHRTNITLMT